MRDGPKPETKIVSEALFGETIHVLEKYKGATLIQTPDQYTGWVMQECFVPLEVPYAGDVEVKRLAAHIYDRADTEYGSILTLPYGSPLKKLDFENPRWLKILLPCGRTCYIQKGDVEPEPFDLVSFSKKFLALPYTWGGRSSFGFDCSGFVQMLYGKLGVQLPRNAHSQVALGNSVEELQLGDLIFWGHSENEIGHVGMFLEGDIFIHTSVRENRPYLRMSRLNDAEWCGKGFYSYRCFRRILDVQGRDFQRCKKTDRFDQSARI